MNLLGNYTYYLKDATDMTKISLFCLRIIRVV